MAVDLLAQVNRVADPNNLTDLERKHVPVACMPEDAKPGACAPVTVHVGKLLAHPNELAHFIGRIEILENGVLLASADLRPVTSCPKVTFDINRKGTGAIVVRCWCNVHGVWEAEVSCGCGTCR